MCLVTRISVRVVMRGAKKRSVRGDYILLFASQKTRVNVITARQNVGRIVPVTTQRCVKNATTVSH